MKSVEVTSVGYDAALSKALEELGLPLEQVDVEVVKETGLLRKKTTLRVSQKRSADVLAVDFIRGIIEKMGIDCQADVFERDDAYVVQLSGPDTATLIGYRGDVLDSLQYLALLVCNKNNPEGKRLVIDGENYRDKRTVTLAKLAKRLAFKAAKTGQQIVLEPMNPFERRIIHSTLHDDKFVTTASEGVEPNRYVVIKPNRTSPRRSYGDGNGYERRGGYNRDGGNSGDGYRREGRAPRSRDGYENREPVPREPDTGNLSEPTDMYNSDYSRNFRKTGVKRMRSFGGPKSKYF